MSVSIFGRFLHRIKSELFKYLQTKRKWGLKKISQFCNRLQAKNKRLVFKSISEYGINFKAFELNLLTLHPKTKQYFTEKQDGPINSLEVDRISMLNKDLIFV